MALQRFPADQEYKRNSELSKDSVRRVLDWVHERAYLPAISEEEAILFLVSCKYDEEVAQRTIDLYYTFKSNHPEMFYNRDPSTDNFSTNSIGLYYVLPGVTHEGYKVMYTKLLNEDLTHFDILKEINIMLCHHDLMLHEAGAVPGWRVIYDMEDTQLAMLPRLRPMAVKNLLYYFQEACPTQLKGIHIVRPKAYVRLFTGLIRPFLKASTADILQTHSDLKDLYKYIPKSILPQDIGGDFNAAKNIRNMSMKRLLENRDTLVTKQNLHAEESLRPKPERSFWGYLWGKN